MATKTEAPEPAATQKLAFSVDEFADLHSLSVSYVRRLIQHEVLKAMKVGGRSLISAESAREFREKMENTPRTHTRGQAAARKANDGRGKLRKKT